MSDTKKHPFNGLYKLRNGIVVEAWPEEPDGWLTPVKVVEAPESAKEDGWGVGTVHSLVGGTQCADPLTWEGGAHGEDYDVIEKL